MKHLDWGEILEAIERDQRPPHLDACSECGRRWSKASEMVAALGPQEEPHADTEAMVRRILLRADDRPSRPVLKLKWALAAGVVICAAGLLAFWQHHRWDVEQQFAAIMAGDSISDPAGLNTLLPRWSFSDLDPWADTSEQYFEKKGE